MLFRSGVPLKKALVVVFSQDLQLRYTWINSPVLAWARQDYIGHTDTEIVGGEDGARLTAIKQEVLRTGVRPRPPNHAAAITASPKSTVGAYTPTTGLNARRTPVAATTATVARPYRQMPPGSATVCRTHRRSLLNWKDTLTS